MARRSRNQIEEIVRSQTHGYRLADETPAADKWSDRSPAESYTPDYQTLRDKYLGSGPNPGAADSFNSPTGEAAHDAEGYDEEIVAVVPETADPWDRASRPKSVVISSDGEIIGSQG